MGQINYVSEGVPIPMKRGTFEGGGHAPAHSYVPTHECIARLLLYAADECMHSCEE